jgi:hypothetical protein
VRKEVPSTTSTNIEGKKIAMKLIHIGKLLHLLDGWIFKERSKLHQDTPSTI